MNPNSKIEKETELNRRTRYVFLDGLRGLACIGVMLHHLNLQAGEFEGAFRSVFPSPIIAWFGFGAKGVQVFFVLSGFVISYSLSDTKLFFSDRTA